VQEVTFGVEEEVFLLEEGRLTPTLQSLDVLRRLYWTNPSKYARYTASNFAKGHDRKQCFMGSVEIATGVHADTDSLIKDLIMRRTAFAHAARDAMIVPVGSLFTLSSPTNTASTHIHIGVPITERNRIYENIAYFLPVLAIASANSPFADGKWFGMSYRMAKPGLLGPLQNDREYRFQDIIISKRLGTLEIRVFDPIPEIDRLTAIIDALKSIVTSDKKFPFDRVKYNLERQGWTTNGVTSYVKQRLDELQVLSGFSSRWVDQRLSERIGKIAVQDSVFAAYSEAEKIWREPTGTTAQYRQPSLLRAFTGIAGYYAFRLPYMAYKGYKEWYGKT
jgi:gamma-glutamyl:cysteine ligase YbdK (ATP-grasp superfamily)